MKVIPPDPTFPKSSNSFILDKECIGCAWDEHRVITWQRSNFKSKCIINDQIWKVISSVKISMISAINRAPIAQNFTHIRASFDPPSQTLTLQRINLRNSFEFEVEFPLF
jgi:hypothetical protein